MNKKNEEYGVERLTKVLQRNTAKSAHGIIETIKEDIELFVGNAEQHDDMTMVVIKAL
jgi:phosphoserine phosphatase RsbU/P